MGLTSSADRARIGNEEFKDRLTRRKGWQERLRDEKLLIIVVLDAAMVCS